MTQKKELLWVRNVPQQTRLHGDCKCLRREWVTRMLSRALQHWVWEERSWHLRNLWNSPSGKHFRLTKNLLPVVRHPQCWLICPWALPSAIHFSSEPQNTSCFAAATARRPHFLMFLPSLTSASKIKDSQVDRVPAGTVRALPELSAVVSGGERGFPN